MKGWKFSKNEVIDLLVNIKDCPLDTVDNQARTMPKVAKYMIKAGQKKLMEYLETKKLGGYSLAVGVGRVIEFNYEDWQELLDDLGVR